MRNQDEGKLPHPAHRLVTWYEQGHRQLPWRNTKDPYRILVSETMLQQTRVETVIPYYYAFLEQFPNIPSLAAAPVEAVLKQWQGLGYYSRARNLKKAAEAIVEHFEGVMPDTLESLLSLPGVGPYTAGAVASIAFDRPAPAVDGNVLRVIARFCGLDNFVDTPAAKRKITDIVSNWLTEEQEQPSLFTQSIMELGAMVCTPRSPKCLSCPLQADCIAFQAGRTLPRKTPKKKRKAFRVVAFWLENEQGILLQKRPESGLLAGMWQLPAVEMEMGGATGFGTAANLRAGTRGQSGLKKDRVRGHYDQIGLLSDHELDVILNELVINTMLQAAPRESIQSAEEGEKYPQAANADSNSGEKEKLQSYVQIGEEKHIFTHLEWHVQVYRPVGVNLDDIHIADSLEMRFVPRKEISSYVLPRVYEKIIGTMLGERVR
jgi:A/G-specific adenine glycosylase